MKIDTTRLKHLSVSCMLVMSVVAGALVNSLPVYAAALTWTGDGDGTTFADGNNWNTDAAPVNGDSLVFDHSTLSGDLSMNNDISSLSVAGITFSGSASGYNTFTISGNALTVTGNIESSGTYSSNNLSNNIDLDLVLGGDISVIDTSILTDNTVTTGGNSMAFSGSTTCGTAMAGNLSGSGPITLSADTATFTGSNAGYTGIINVQGYVIATPAALGSDSVGTVVSGGGILSIYTTGSTSISEPFTLGGNGSIGSQSRGALACGGSSVAKSTTTLTGDVSLTSNFVLDSNNDVVISGNYDPSDFTFSVKSGSTGTLTTPEGTTDVPEETIEAKDNQPEKDESASNKQTLILTGTRGTVSIDSGGTLKGTGTATTVSIVTGGVINPGLSPGTITVLEDFSISGTYEAEILDADSYDIVRAGSVQIMTGATLDTILYEGYDIKEGDQFQIVDNTGGDPVSGTFEGLDEGAQIEVGNITFSITYEGGDGNDIVLTALNTGSDPNAPNTGLATITKNNPVVVLILGLASAAILVVASRRLVTNKN
jgi:hypothetical protein